MTRIPVETNASFEPLRSTLRTNYPPSEATRFSVAPDLVYSNVNRSDLVFSDAKTFIIYDADPSDVTDDVIGDVEGRSLGYDGNESLLFLSSSPNATYDDVTESDFDFGPPKVFSSSSSTPVARKASRVKPTTALVRKASPMASRRPGKKDRPGPKNKKNKDRRRKKKKKKKEGKKPGEAKKKKGESYGAAVTSSVSKMRLPSSVIPVHYVLRLRPHFDDFSVDGSVEIEVEVRTATARIKLHSSRISVNKTSVKVSSLTPF